MNIEQVSYYVSFAAFVIVIASWFAFAAGFFLRKKPQTSSDAVKEPKSWAGLILQGISYAPVWALQRRPMFSNFVPNDIANIALQIFGVFSAIGSVALVMLAVRELGKQWSLEARLVEDHALIMTGPYNLVRHPIYTAMLGMLIATGIVISHWAVASGAVIVFLIGTFIRTRFEERLLRDAFGEEFAKWKARVPGLIPFLKF
jgi:protein-S-isoprenylcysteine O-methyltransferase Ste14